MHRVRVWTHERELTRGSLQISSGSSRYDASRTLMYSTAGAIFASLNRICCINPADAAYIKRLRSEYLKHVPQTLVAVGVFMMERSCSAIILTQQKLRLCPLDFSRLKTVSPSDCLREESGNASDFCGQALPPPKRVGNETVLVNASLMHLSWNFPIPSHGA
jgi:hypothetical protein